MAQPSAVHRIKSYSAASGFVYQYRFHELLPSRRGAAPGNEYTYLVSADRRNMFPLKIFVRRDSVERWRKKFGRPLTGTEEYAVAKMRLFDAFDETDNPADFLPDLLVDDSNLDALLTRLDL
jgi:hypothetical protein